MISMGFAESLDNEDIETWKQHLAAQIKHDLDPLYIQARAVLRMNLKKHAQPSKEQQFRMEFNQSVHELQELAEKRYIEETRRERERRSIPAKATRRTNSRSEWEANDRSNSRASNLEGPPEWFSTIRQELDAMGYQRSTSRSRQASSRILTPVVHDKTKASLDEERLRRFAEEQARLRRAEANTSIKTEQGTSQVPGHPEIPWQQRWFADQQANLAKIVAEHKQAPSFPTDTSRSRSQAFEAVEDRELPGTNPETLWDGGYTRKSKVALVDTVEKHHKMTKEGVRKTDKISLQEPANRDPPVNSHETIFLPTLKDHGGRLESVEVLFFDILGTMLDWHGTVTRALKRQGDRLLPEEMVDWGLFAREWRNGYMTAIRRIVEAGSVPQVDIIYRDVLDAMLNSERWSRLACLWTDEERDDLTFVWHRLDGWLDAGEGLRILGQDKTLVTLSNIPLRTQLDMSRHAGLKWDAHLSGALLRSYKPDPNVYLQAARSMPLPTFKCAMVSAHIWDLRAAAGQGMKTIYLRRHSEDGGSKNQVKSKMDGGEVDIVVDSLTELATIIGSGSGLT